MNKLSSFHFKFALVMTFMGATLALADTRGKIAGRVIDVSTGLSLVGVNVYIPEEQVGAVTNADGYYYILNVSPGLHTVSASYIGYKTSTVHDVQVVSDQTTSLNFGMETSILEGEEVVVTAERPLIQADLTSSKATITAQDLKILPTETFQGLLSTKAGVTLGAGGAMHVRGGRASEILYMVDGIPVPNPFSSRMGLSISTNMISELTLISGTFNAEYGKAMSGIVNLVTREGGRKLEGEARFQSGDMYSFNTDLFQDANEFNPINFTRTDLSLSGPLPLLPRASFLVTGSLRQSQGWLYGLREHHTYDYSNLSKGTLMMTGDSSRVAMNPSNARNIMAKLTFRPWASGKITYQFTESRSNWQNYEHRWKFNPDGRYHHESSNALQALHFSQTLSEKTYFTIKGAYRTANAEQYVHKLKVPYTWDETTYYTSGDDISRHDINGDGVLSEITVDWDSLRVNGGYIPNPNWYPINVEGLDSVRHYVPNDFPGGTRTVVPAYHFYYGGQHTGYYLSDHQTTTLKFDLTSQVTPAHQLRMGIDANLYQLHSNSINIIMNGATGWQPYIYPNSHEGASHVEYRRAPVEFSAYLQDKIELETIILNLGIRYDYFNANDSTFTNKTDPVKDTTATAKNQISPRLGVSFPITDQGYIHFSYGHFFQMPPFSYFYRNPDLLTPAGTLLQFGNPDLEPQKTVTYELGLQQQLSPTTAVDVTMFYKNILNWLSSEYNFIHNDFRYTRYITEDYGNTRGVTVALVQRTAVGFSLNVDYTYEIAEGNSSSPDEAYYDALANIESEKKVVPLTWDVRHTANATVSYRTSGGLGLSLITRYSAGLPYTPTIQGLRWAEENSGRKPIHLLTDMQAFKTFNVGSHRLTASLKVYNLFDRMNERYVFTDTGRATYSLTPTYSGDPAEKYPDLPGVHRLDEYLYSPLNYRNPRQILLSLGWSF